MGMVTAFVRFNNGQVRAIEVGGAKNLKQVVEHITEQVQGRVFKVEHVIPSVLCKPRNRTMDNLREVDFHKC